MCAGVPIFANNKKALYGKRTNSHTESAEQLKIDEDKYRKFEYLWWDKKLKQVHYDRVAEDILNKINIKIATNHAKNLVKKEFNTQDKLAQWLKGVPDEWDKLMEPKFRTLAKKVNPKLVIYQDKIAKFKKTPIEKYNPYQATKLPDLATLKKRIPAQVRAQVWPEVWTRVRAQVWARVRAQVWDQVWEHVWAQARAQVWDHVWDQVGDQVGAQARARVRAQVWDQVGDQVWVQARAQVWMTSYWGIKIALGLPIHHWFSDLLKLGVMIIFVKGKVKVFGKKGKFLGEYDQKDFR